MDKISLQELSGYLPWKLKIKTSNIIREMVLVVSDFDNETLMSNVLQGIGHKPILYPLKELTTSQMLIIRDMNFGEQYNRQWTKKHYNFIRKVQSFPLLQDYLTVELLHKWHFDVHGLIKKGLAVDITTLK